jgi:hypothetical protein
MGELQATRARNRPVIPSLGPTSTARTWCPTVGVSGVSAQSETWPAADLQIPAVGQIPSVTRQYQDVMSCSAGETGQVAVTWQQLAELLDELVTQYDEHLECGHRGESDRAAADALSDVLDGFDVAAAVARGNAEVLDDLATEITIAQARMRAIWNEMEADLAGQTPLSAVALERSYSARAAREAWYPLDGDLTAARDRLQVVRGEG